MNISKDLILILIIALLIFGPTRLAGLGSALGKAIHDFRTAVDGDAKEDRSQTKQPPDPTAH